MLDGGEKCTDDRSKDAKSNLHASIHGEKLRLSLNNLEKQLKDSTMVNELFILRVSYSQLVAY